MDTDWKNIKAGIETNRQTREPQVDVNIPLRVPDFQ